MYNDLNFAFNKIDDENAYSANRYQEDQKEILT